MAPDPADAPPPAPRFEEQGVRASRSDVVHVARGEEGIELRFGASEVRPHPPGATGVALTHHVRLELSAARHLEDALTRVLGLSPGPAPDESPR